HHGAVVVDVNVGVLAGRTHPETLTLCRDQWPLGFRRVLPHRANNPSHGLRPSHSGRRIPRISVVVPVGPIVASGTWCWRGRRGGASTPGSTDCPWGAGAESEPGKGDQAEAHRLPILDWRLVASLVSSCKGTGYATPEPKGYFPECYADKQHLYSITLRHPA